MKPRERVLRAIYHEEPDIVPLFEPYGIYPPTADIVLGRPCVATNSLRGVKLIVQGKVEKYRKLIVRDWYELVKKLKLDGGPIVKGYSVIEDHASRNVHLKIVDEFTWMVNGSVYRYSPSSGATLEIDSAIRKGGVQAFENHIKEMEETTDDELDEAISEFSVFDEWLSKLWKKLDVLVFMDTGQLIPCDSSWLPVFLKCLYMHPSLVRRYLRQQTRRILRTINVAKDFGAELFYIGGDIAHNRGPIIPPRLYREFILPEVKLQTQAIHKIGGFAFISSDGNLWPIINDYLINSGADGMMEIQTTAGMNLAKLKDLYGDEICFQGGVDCQYTLVFGDAGRVAKETRNAIRILSPGGGHILCSSNSIHSGVKPENFFIMLDVGRKYGVYARR